MNVTKRFAAAIGMEILFAFSAKRLNREALLSTSNEASLSTSKKALPLTGCIARLLPKKNKKISLIICIFKI
jgi:hypothetical protein